MRKASSEMLMLKVKAEKDCKKMNVKLRAQKAKSKADTAIVIERMRITCEREKTVAVSDATIELASDLKKSTRGVLCLQHTLNKYEVTVHLKRDPCAKPSPFFWWG
jgi:hypothetical protein